MAVIKSEMSIISVISKQRIYTCDDRKGDFFVTAVEIIFLIASYRSKWTLL